MATERVLWAFIIALVLIFVAAMVVVVPSTNTSQTNDEIASIKVNLQESTSSLSQQLKDVKRQLDELSGLKDLQAHLKELSGLKDIAAQLAQLKDLPRDVSLLKDLPAQLKDIPAQLTPLKELPAQLTTLKEIPTQLKDLQSKIGSGSSGSSGSSGAVTRSNHCAPYQNMKIEPITDYLRSPKWFADKTNANVEDRSYIDFLINHYVPSNSTRKVYIDLGGNTFPSSIIWMRDNYHLKFDDIYVFEGVAGLFVIPPAKEIGEEFHKSIHFQEIWLDTKDSPGKLNFPKWMEDLHLKEDDFVVMKMDIEEMEWEMLPAIEARGLDKVIDELFVEIHYTHPDMLPWGWGQFKHNIDETKALLHHWRDLGVYTHYWP